MSDSENLGLRYKIACELSSLGIRLSELLWRKRFPQENYDYRLLEAWDEIYLLASQALGKEIEDGS